jgi:GTPase Era involved in 16S rRNA processing
MKQGFNSIYKIDEGTLVFGATNSGKSTTTSLLVGKNMKIVESEGDL